uniref:Uncharacterized protein n=1 Tax=Acrobeloides nanus TaxID=290746 RepID=A0A914CJF1_9BILA
IVPLVVSQAEPTKRVQRRVIATRLLEKLCSIVPVECVKKDLAPCAQMLCQDPSAAVRTSVAQRLSMIADSLKNSTDCVSLLLPCLIELCKDDDPGVREAILNTIAVCLPYFTKESRKSVVIPLIRKCTEQALFLKDTSLTVVAKQIGPWLDSVKEILSQQELKWFLDTYCRLVDISMGDSDKISALLCTACRRMCAYNFPCFAMVYGKESFNEKLMPILDRFCTDGDDEVRSTISSGFHEIIQMRPDEPALVGPFIELIRGGAPEVVQQMTGNLHKTLPPLYECIKKYTGTVNVKISRIQLDRILIGCNRLLRGTGSWRSHESYLNNIACIRHLIPFHDLYVSFLPMLKQEVLTVRALPCRIAASQTLLLMMREFPMEKNRNTVIEFFTTTIGSHESCNRRRLLLDVVPIVLQHFSREFFKQHFLESVLKLAHDKISNIR